MTCKHCFHWDRASETFNTEIQTCCECGYVDTSISRVDKLVRQAVELGFYQQTKNQEAISRVRALAERYANEAEKDNPQGYGGKPKTLDNSISYWLVSREIWEALDGANSSADDVQKVVE